MNVSEWTLSSTVGIIHITMRISRWLGWRAWWTMVLVKPLLFWNESHTFWLCFWAFDPTALASSHMSNTHRTKLSSEPSNPQCLPETLLTIPCFIPFSKQMASLAPSMLVHLLSASVCLPLESHNQYFTPRIALDFPLWWASLVTQMVKNLPTVQEIQVWFLGQEDLLEKEMATHSSTHAWRIPWTEKPSGL